MNSPPFSPPFSPHTTDSPVCSNIIVTTPSSPETRTRISPSAGPSQDAFTFHTSDNLIPPSPPISPPRSATTANSSILQPTSDFHRLMQNADLPEPGPAFFAARRALWRIPTSNPLPSQESSQSRQRLEALLNHAVPPESDRVWNAGIGMVWRGIIGGARLKRRLPLNSLIKILQAGWIRDGTWPRGGIPPDPDDELPMDEDGQVTTEAATPISPDALSRVTTPAIGHDSPGPSLHHHQFIWNTGTPVER